MDDDGVFIADRFSLKTTIVTAVTIRTIPITLFRVNNS